MVLAAAKTVNTPLIVSIEKGDEKEVAIRNAVPVGLRMHVETEVEFLAKMDNFERIRTCSDQLSDAFYKKAAQLGKYVATAKPIVEGRIELLHYVKEQSISFEYHRYGSITVEMS